MLDNTIATVGIDISKEKFDACILTHNGKRHSMELLNNRQGFEKLMRWVAHKAPECSLHFCMESTGSYWRALAEYLADRGLLVSVINPFVTKHAAINYGSGNKTDKADAYVLAQYCRKEKPGPWRMSLPEIRILVELLRRYQALMDMLQAERNRLTDPGLVKPVQSSVAKSVRFLEKEVARVRAQISDHIDRHPDLKRDHELIESIPGIGELTASWLITVIAEKGALKDAKSLAAYVGLAPRRDESGKIVKKSHITKRGSAHIRRALYMPALTAMRFNPVAKALYDRLLAAGKSRMCAVVAVMRKLVMLAYGVVKTGTKFKVDQPQAAAA
jgi:transposase